MLTSNKDPDSTLRRLSEAGVFGRFVPDFGRVVAQMQHDMYHVYTVDEHTVFAIGILHGIENGTYLEEMPISSEVVHNIKSRRALCGGAVARYQSRSGNHSELGADLALDLCPRFGLTEEETETVEWLVRYRHCSAYRVPAGYQRSPDDHRPAGRAVGGTPASSAGSGGWYP